MGILRKIDRAIVGMRRFMKFDMGPDMPSYENLSHIQELQEQRKTLLVTPCNESPDSFPYTLIYKTCDYCGEGMPEFSYSSHLKKCDKNPYKRLIGLNVQSLFSKEEDEPAILPIFVPKKEYKPTFNFDLLKPKEEDEPTIFPIKKETSEEKWTIPKLNFDLVNDMQKRQEEERKKEAQKRRNVSIAVLHVHEREAQFGLTPFTRRLHREQADTLRYVLSHPPKEDNG